MRRAGLPGPACERVQGRLERWLDGTLSPLEEALDRGHLEVCAACQRERAGWEQLLDEIRAATQPDPSEAVLEAERMASFVRERRAQVRGRTRVQGVERLLLARVGAAAALLALVLMQASGIGLDVAPRVEDFASLDEIWERLPSWSEVVDGLSSLSRHLS